MVRAAVWRLLGGQETVGEGEAYSVEDPSPSFSIDVTCFDCLGHLRGGAVCAINEMKRRGSKDCSLYPRALTISRIRLYNGTHSGIRKPPRVISSSSFLLPGDR